MPSSTSSSELPHPIPPDTPAGRRPLRALAISLVTLVVTLALAEAVARRVFDPSRLDANRMFVLDPDVGWRFPAHQDTPTLEWFGKVQPLPYRTNNRGLKGTRDYPAPREDGEIRVLCLGDSTANMTHFDGYPEYLERILQAAVPGRKFWVMNAGVNGFSSLNMKFMAEQEIPLFEPDFVIITVGTDDAMLSNRRDRVDYEVRSFGDFLARTGQRSRLITGARRWLPQSLIHAFANTPGSTISHERTVEMVSRTDPDEAKEYFAEAVDLAREAGAFPILTLQPWLFWNVKESDPGQLHLPLTPWTQRIHEVAMEKQTALVDGIALFDRPDRAAFWMVHPRPADKFGMVTDPIHLNGPGNERLAAEYARVILSELRRREPDLAIDFAAVDAVVEKYRTPPRPDPDYVSGVPSDEYFAHVTDKMNRLNADENPRPWDGS